MATVSKRSVDAAQPAEDCDTYLWDADLKGFGLKVTPAGSKGYLFQYRSPLTGKTRRLTLGKHGVLTPDEARRKAMGAAASVAEGRDPQSEKLAAREGARSAMTVAALADDFLAHFADLVAAGRRSERTCTDYRYILDNIVLPNIGSIGVAQLSTTDIVRLKQKLSRKHGATSADGALRVLSSLLSYGVTIGQTDTNVAARMGQFQTPRRERFLSHAELARLGEALSRASSEGLATGRGNGPARLNPVGLAAIRLLLVSGMRLGEVLGLRWTDIDHERELITLTRHKTSARTGAKTIPLTAPIAAILDEAIVWRQGTWVFPGKKPGAAFVGLQKVWQAVRKAAELNDVRLHDLRHSFASIGVSDGLGLPIVGSLLGHTSAAMTHRYAHLHDDPRRQAAELIAGKIEAAASSKASPLVVPVFQRSTDESVSPDPHRPIARTRK